MVVPVEDVEKEGEFRNVVYVCAAAPIARQRKKKLEIQEALLSDAELRAVACAKRVKFASRLDEQTSH